MSIDPQRTRAIREFNPPRDAKGVSRFIGMVNFYHKFIPCLADLAAPLNALRKKGARFVWGTEQESFEQLKQAIAQPPLLRMADFSKTFIVQTDARGVALGAVLSQGFDNLLPMLHALSVHKNVRPHQFTNLSV